MGSRPNEVRAPYGLVSPAASSYGGRSCRRPIPARSSHAAQSGRSAISPMPQSRSVRMENRGMVQPATRDRDMRARACRTPDGPAQAERHAEMSSELDTQGSPGDATLKEVRFSGFAVAPLAVHVALPAPLPRG